MTAHGNPRPRTAATARTTLIVIAALLAGCTMLGPEFSSPTGPTLPSEWNQAESEASQQEISQWWARFNDPVLNELIERGARQNLSLEAAGLRIVQARAALGISDALVFPQQQRASGNLGALYQNDHGFKTSGLTLDVGWEIDVWGKYARGIEQSEAQLYASVASYRDVLVSITAEIARNYINYRTSQERAYLSEQNIAIQQRVVDMTQVQFDSGNVSELDVQQAKTQLYATQAALPALNLSRLKSRNAIAVLLGTIPEEVEGLLLANSSRKIPSYDERMAQASNTSAQTSFVNDYDTHSLIPVYPRLESSIDPTLIRRRPDLQVAELQARAQNARIGQRQTDLYPQFVLFGSLGLSDTVPSGGSFSTSNAVTAAVGPGFSWNIFQYDRIKNQVRIEDAQFQESLSNYNQSVLLAVNEVSDALLSYEYFTRQSRFNLAAVEASIRAFNISATQYDNGLVTYQRLLSTVEKMTLREDTYAQVRGNIANAVVGLYKALGGGWQAMEGIPLVKPEQADEMRRRTDWGEYLEPATITGEDRSDRATP